MPIISDGYLDWTVAEGGVPVGSTMPPFKDVLKPIDIWKVILFVQTL
jgi:mono/diheme cytochrome c family protein